MDGVTQFDELKRSWAITMKDMRIYFLRPGTLASGILFPVALFFSFAVGRNIPNDLLIPVLAAQTILWSSSSIGPAAFPLERRMRTFERYLSAPISLFAVLWGKTMAGVIFGLGITVAATAIGAVAIGVSVTNIAAVAIGVVLSTIVFSAMGTLFASIPSENPGEVIMPLNLVRIPLMFVSGMFIPIESLPRAGVYAALVSPLTHTLDLLKIGFGGTSHFGWPINIAVLVIWVFVFLSLSQMLHEFFDRKRR
jgi:ABC-2 type transport system permease protein